MNSNVAYNYLCSQPIIAHDDIVSLRFQKHEMGLEDDWWKRCRVGDTYAWFMKLPSGDFLREPLGRFANDAQARSFGYAPMVERSLSLRNGVELVARGSYVELVAPLFSEPFATRYRVMLLALQNACEKGVVSYSGCFGRGSRQCYEALRHRARKYSAVSRYEHNFLFSDLVGEPLLRELRSYDEAAGRWENTVYLSGYHSSGANLVRFYRVADNELVGRLGSRFKLEIVFRENVLRYNEARSLVSFGTQPEIQERLAASLLRQTRKVLGPIMQNGRSVAMAALRSVTNSNTNSGAVNSMFERSRTYYEMLRRISELEQSRDLHERRIFALEQEMLRQRQEIVELRGGLKGKARISASLSVESPEK